jgi:hypothetical protein
MLHRLAIDLDGLENAFENNARTVSSYLNLRSGEITRLVEGMTDPQVHARFRADPTCLRIPAVPAPEQYRWLEAFVNSVTNPEIRADLAHAITTGPGAFGRFKRVLQGHLPEIQQWWTFRRERVRVAMNTWLAHHELEPLPLDPEMVTPTSEHTPATTRGTLSLARFDVPPASVRASKPTATDCRERLDELAGMLRLSDLDALNDVGDFLVRVRHARALRTGG